MSRLIIKNLPNGVTEDKVRQKFSEIGVVTDVQLKYMNGKFRNFAFVGYKSEENAQEAIRYLNNTYMGTKKMQVELCTNLGSADKPRAWSKHTKGSSAYAHLHPEESIKVDEEDKWKEKRKGIEKKKDENAIQDPKVKELLEKYKEDPQFQEFMETHLGKNSLWSNDVLGGTGDGPAVTEDTLKELQEKTVDSIPDENIATAKISDFEYLRRKMVKSKTETKTDSSDVLSKETDKKGKISEQKLKNNRFSVVIRGLPFSVGKKEVKEFMKEYKPKSVHLPRQGFAYVGFETEKEAKRALIKNRSFINNSRIFVNLCKEKNGVGNDVSITKNEKFRQQEESLKNEETVAESGRIFVRNLTYTVTEDDLLAVFSKYGEVSEISLPIDSITRNIKGFATVTFLLPEHAVNAYSDLDGHILQGRMLHLLPAKSKPSIDELLEQEGLDYKKKKELKQKKEATLSHSWNTLFLGQNAVTDLIAETYNTTKENVLDDSGKGSVAVRLALGETQIVNETKKFLIDNGVQLDAFNRPTTDRSKTIILVKNLPAKTTASEIRALFEPSGVVGRVILPPSGVTGIVEFMDKIEAKKAFLRLAFSKFKNLPLYLEWAPEGALSQGSQSSAETPSVKPQEKGQKNDESEVKEEMRLEDGTTLYIKNLNFCTSEERLIKHFQQCGEVATATIATKPDPRAPGNTLSQGFGFIQYYRKRSADEAMKYLQHSDIDGYKVELKRSDRTSNSDANTRKSVNQSKPTGTKILVRNIPFQATENEVRELFKVFGEIKTLRLPKKMAGTGTGSHRGFAFVDFQSKNDAKKAMESLCQSTHLYGRRLVLEWANEEEENVDALRKRTAQQFSADAPHSKTFRKGFFDMALTSKKLNDDD